MQFRCKLHTFDIKSAMTHKWAEKSQCVIASQNSDNVMGRLGMSACLQEDSFSCLLPLEPNSFPFSSVHAKLKQDPGPSLVYRKEKSHQESQQWWISEQKKQKGGKTQRMSKKGSLRSWRWVSRVQMPLGQTETGLNCSHLNPDLFIDSLFRAGLPRRRTTLNSSLLDSLTVKRSRSFECARTNQ